MPRDSEDRGAQQFRHEVIYSEENESKCDGLRLIEIGGYEVAVRCDQPHAHQHVDCWHPSGSGPVTHAVTEKGDHGKHVSPRECPGGMVTRLGTESHAREVHAARAEKQKKMAKERGPTGFKALVAAMADHDREPAEAIKKLVALVNERPRD